MSCYQALVLIRSKSTLQRRRDDGNPRERVPLNPVIMTDNPNYLQKIQNSSSASSCEYLTINKNCSHFHGLLFFRSRTNYDGRLCFHGCVSVQRGGWGYPSLWSQVPSPQVPPVPLNRACHGQDTVRAVRLLRLHAGGLSCNSICSFCFSVYVMPARIAGGRLLLEHTDETASSEAVGQRRIQQRKLSS